MLVVATLMGFATVSSAKFSDDSSVTYKEAVEVMSGIGVINGYTDGSFRPAANVKRAEMAKMVAYILASGEDVGPLYAGANSFTDCVNHWAKGYIAYASKTGIVAGVGNGKFNPEGSVTGTQAAKMLLCALGYDAAAETYTGANWSVNVLADAKDAGLLKGLAKVDMSAALSREAAAQMMFNALKATMVEYDRGNTTIINGDTSVIIGGSSAKEVANNDSSYKTSDKVNDDFKGTMQLCEKYFEDLKLNDGDPDAFGRPGHAWYNGKINDDNKIGTYADEPTFTYTADVSAKDAAKALKNYTAKAEGINQYSNGAPMDPLDADDLDNVKKNGLKMGNGVIVEVYADDDNVITDFVAIHTYIAKVTDVVADKAKTEDEDESALKLSVYGMKAQGASVSVTAAAEDDVIGFEEVYKTAEEDDYILVTPYGDGTDAKTVVSVAAAEKVTGTKTASGSDYIRIDGEKYETGKYFANMNESTFDNTCDFYLFEGYVIAAVETEAGDEALNYLQFKAVSSDAGDDFEDAFVKVKVTYLDGKTEIVNYEIKEANGTPSNQGANEDIKDGDSYIVAPDGKKYEVDDNMTAQFKDVFYSYKTNSNGEITLTALKADKADGSNDTLYVKEGEARVYNHEATSGQAVVGVANSSTILNVVKDGKVSTYTGYKNFPTQDFDNVKVLLVMKSGSDLSTIYVMGGSVSTSVTYAYYTGVGEMTNDGQMYNFYVDGENVSYLMDSAPEAGKVVFTLDVTDNKAEAAAVTKGITEKAVVDGVGENYFKVNEFYGYYAEDIQVYNVTDTDDIVEDSVEKGDTITYVLDDDKNVAIVYITKEA